MELIIKEFNELTAEELFDIYKLRVSVFVVEQECPYQEVDDFDKLSFHVIMKEDDEIVAYLRVLPAGTVFDEVSFGRVISTRRRQGIGTEIVKQGIRVAKEKFGADIITIEAQVYVRELYDKLGFVQTSEEFLEDGIPHIQMQLQCTTRKDVNYA